MKNNKFRAWDNHAKQWMLGYELPNLGGFSLLGEVMLMGEWSAVVSRFILNQRDRTSKDLIIEQFTGLEDGNNKEIYEGDIVEKMMDHPDHEWHGRHVVEFRNGIFGLVGGSPHGFRSGEIFNWYPHNVKVVGNIRENSELLNVK